MTELQLQANCWQWTWNLRPQTRKAIWSVPNGGARRIVEATQLQATGVIPGVHDLNMLWDFNFYTFELKVGDNPLSQPQKEWAAVVIAQGGVWFEVRDNRERGLNGVEIFRKVFDEVLSGLHKRR